jgi:acid stress-induced BolA-like protein IbaG/YrbA
LNVRVSLNIKKLPREHVHVKGEGHVLRIQEPDKPVSPV